MINDLVRLVNPTGNLGIIGVYAADDPRGVDEHAKKREYLLPFGQLWGKGLIVGKSQTPVKKVILMLRNIIIAGATSTGFIVSHRISIEDVPDAY